jgi:hypothetical protein
VIAAPFLEAENPADHEQEGPAMSSLASWTQLLVMLPWRRSFTLPGVDGFAAAPKDPGTLTFGLLDTSELFKTFGAFKTFFTLPSETISTCTGR